MKLLSLVLVGTLAVALVAFPVVARDGDRCEDQGCNSAGTKLNPPTSRGGWSIPTKTVVNALLKAYNLARNTSYRIHPLVGLLIPSVGIERSGPIVGTVDVIECEDCCGEAQRLMVVPVVESKGQVSRRSGPLNFPPWETTTAARGGEILDWDSLQRPTDKRDGNSSRGTVIREDYNIASGNTSFTLSFLAGLAEITAYTSPRADDLTALSDDELEKMAPVQVNDKELEGLTAYCGCVDRDATEKEIEEMVPDLVNTAPLSSFMPTIEISLDGTTQVPGAFSAGDPDGDPVWVYYESETLQRAGLRFSIDQTTGHATFWFEGLSPEDAEAIAANPASREPVYLYDLKPGVEPVPGERPEEGQYFHEVDKERVNLIFTRSQPPEAMKVQQFVNAAQLRDMDCQITVRCQARDDDPFGALHGRPIAIVLDWEQAPDGFEWEWSLSNMQHGVGEAVHHLGSGECEALAYFSYLGCSPSRFSTTPPVGTYDFPFTVVEISQDGTHVFPAEGVFQLVVENTPPTAVDDAFDMSTNAAGASQSVVCDVLANDSDIDGDELIAIKIVEGRGPGHGEALVATTEDGRLVITYTSTEGHGGADLFKYQVSDVPEADREDTDWSNVATVTVTTLTPPDALSTTVWAHPDPVTLEENYQGPWQLHVDSLLLQAIDLDAEASASLEDDSSSTYLDGMRQYEFGVLPGGVTAELGITIASLCGSSISGRRICGRENSNCSFDHLPIVSLSCPVTIEGPRDTLTLSRWPRMQFSFTLSDPDGYSSEPGIITVYLINEDPQPAETFQSRYISFCFGEPMIYPLEPAWYEAGCLSFTDPDGDPLTFRISRQPRKGRADLMQSGGGGEYEVTVMYHIDHDDAMLDHMGAAPFVDYLTVEAKDPFGATAETLVEITVDVINSDPVCVDDEVTTPMNTAVEFDVLGNDSDIDGDELTVIAVGVAGSGVASSVAHNMIRYEPLAGFYGDDTFTYTAEDGYGGSDYATVTVHVVDTEPPVFVKGPGDVGPLSNIVGTCGAAGKWTAPVADVDVTDNIGLASLTSTHASGDTFPVGITTVTYTATDLSGNTTDHTFTVTVVDDERPTIDGMPSDICVEVTVGVTETTVSWIEPTARDNCGIDNLVGTHTPGAVFPLGKTSAVYTATDIHGNVVTESFGFTVAEAWQLACSNKYVATSNPSGTTVSFADPVVGGCGVTTTFDPVSGSFFDIGDTDVLCEVTDGVRTETCTFTVTVEFVNHDPVANGDVVDLKDSEIATEIDVLKNDSDADGDDLTITRVSTPSPCGEAWIDPDGQSVWFIGMYCQPYLGGTATFTYTISDGNGGEDTGTVSVDLPDSGTMPEVAEPPKDGR